MCHCIYGENKVCHFAFALKEREENKKKSPTISKWRNGGVFKESLSLMIMRGGRGRRVREWEWDDFFCAETLLCNIICFVFCFWEAASQLLCCVTWSILDQFLCFSLKSRERMSDYWGGGGGGGPITMFLLLVECLNFVSVASDVVCGLGQVDL